MNCTSDNTVTELETNAGSLPSGRGVMEGEKLKPPTRPVLKDLVYPPLWKTARHDSDISSILKPI